MKQTLFVSILLFLTACSSKYADISSKPTYRCVVDATLAPKWVCKEYRLDGYLSTVVVEPYDPQKILSLDQAKAKAKKQLEKKANARALSIGEIKQLKLWVEPNKKENYILFIAPIE